jgi:pantoate--beta-alanine ligase
MRRCCRSERGGGRRLGFVPTMGALHEGHLSLVRAAKCSCEVVAASIFVNPTQFGPNEDLASYPRTLDRDRRLLEGEGVDLLFAPSVDEMYPAGVGTWVTVEGISDRLDGRSRPGHFRGVTTVVAKLLHVVEPEAVFLGQKDAAQVAILRRMVHDLNFPAEVVACPIVREKDGLAMSSRNAYLDTREREQARVLYRSLLLVKRAWQAGEKSATMLRTAGSGEISREAGVRMDYLEIVDGGSLEAVQEVREGSLVVVAAWVGGTRLIDNILLSEESNDA